MLGVCASRNAHTPTLAQKAPVQAPAKGKKDR